MGQATANDGPVFITTMSLSPGPHQITATVEDVAGNVAPRRSPVAVLIQTTPPTTPTLGLDAALQTVTGQPTETTDQVVGLTGTTSPGADVALFRAFDPNTPIMKTRADSSGNFTFSNVALAPGTQAFTVVASDVAGNSSQAVQSITTTAIDTRPGHHGRPGR